MRLSSKEIKAIRSAFSTHLDAIPYQLYLFGSRTDKNKKGGDIDLLVIVPSESKQMVIELKGKIRNQIFNFIPEQKIDITVATKAELRTDPFLKEIAPKALPLGH